MMRGWRRGKPRSARGGPGAHELISEELLEFDAANRTRGLCHLLRFSAGDSGPVCLVGNFDGGVGPATGSAIEAVATAGADRVGREDFRLIEWYPRGPEAYKSFSEVTLTPVPATAISYGELVVDSGAGGAGHRHTVLVRFAGPEWEPRSEDELAALLGEPAIRQLRSFAGLPGDYTPERLFGSSGRRRAEAIREHNRQVSASLGAQLEEWS